MTGRRGEEPDARPDRVVMGAHLPEGVPRSAANVAYSVGALAQVMTKWVKQPYRRWSVRELSAASDLNRRTVGMVVRDLIAAGHAVEVAGGGMPGAGRRPALYRLTPTGMSAWRDHRVEARVRHRPVRAKPVPPRL